MFKIARKYSEIIAIAQLEPKLKSIYVEGVSDYFLISNYIKHINKSDVVIYMIDDIDFSELYERMDKEQVKRYITNNKERVILLAHSLEVDTKDSTLPIVCIVDIDWDIVNGNVRSGCYLCYTDYNSMDMYLFDYDVVEKFLHQGNRIKKVDAKTLLDTLSVVGRQLFHVHCIVNDFNEGRIKNLKEFKFDKNTYKCSLEFDDYWQKTLNKCGLKSNEVELKKLYKTRISCHCDARMEIQGHDFVCLLHRCVKKIKDSKAMDLENFGNVFWQYINLDALSKEPLFIRISSL